MRGGVYGHLVGDALGVPYEFLPPERIGRVELKGGGAHGQPPGTWSDDGALMLALLDSLASAGFDPEDQGRRALDWADRGAYTPDGDGRFDIGGATAAALARLRNGTPAIDAGGIGERDSGNGSLMRILPIALWGAGADDRTLVERARLASRVTHGHPRCQAACALYVLITRHLLDHPADAPAAILDASVSRLRERSDPALEELLAHRSNMHTWGGGFVLDSFWCAWEAFAGADSYRQTLERAIGFGHDTDTTAAIAGGMAGLRWGLEGIPREWLSALRDKDIVENILTRWLRAP